MTFGDTHSLLQTMVPSIRLECAAYRSLGSNEPDLAVWSEKSADRHQSVSPDFLNVIGREAVRICAMLNTDHVHKTFTVSGECSSPMSYH